MSKRFADFDVVALSAYPEVAPSMRVRVLEMGEHMAREGVSLRSLSTITTSEYRDLAATGRWARKLTVVARSAARATRRINSSPSLTLVHRLTSLLPPPVCETRVDVYDFDDAIYLGHRASSGGAMGWLKLEPTRVRAYLRRARLVLAGNLVLAEAARQFTAQVEVVPSCVDPWHQPLRDHSAANPVLTLGWTGSRTTSAYLTPVLAAVSELHAQGRPVRTILMGADESLRGPGIEHRRWSAEAEREMLTEIDVGVMPMPETPWTRGKCGYKLLRYFAAGLPTIGAPVGINAHLLNHSGGLAAASPAEFIRAIDELRGDASARGDRGRRARSFVERDYSFQTWAPRLASLLTDLEC